AFVCIIVETLLALGNEWSSFQLLNLVDGVGEFTDYTPSQILGELGPMIEARERGNRVIILFFNLGLLLFSYLFYRSHYLPQLLARAGLLITALMMVLVLVRLMLNIPLGTVGAVASLLLLLFQLVFGAWLLLKGIRGRVELES
ncbi:MAG: DUF4386 family protein, partial [Bacteroidota bacterium]